VYYDGRDVLPLEAAVPADWGRIMSDFNLVNDAWIAGRPPQTPAVDVMEAVSLVIEVLSPAAVLDGCDPRAQPPGERGAVVCLDRLAGQTGPAQDEATAELQRYRALVPTHAELGVRSAFSLHLSINGYAANWPLQEHLFATILETLKPY
jgi:hypothetical protein